MASMIAGWLVTSYQQEGKAAEADALRQESASVARTPRERFAALFPLLQQAESSENHAAMLDRFFEAYYAISESLEPCEEFRNKI